MCTGGIGGADRMGRSPLLPASHSRDAGAGRDVAIASGPIQRQVGDVPPRRRVEPDEESGSVAETSEDFIYVRERRLPYETFDADNHLYENQDALTKFLPRKYEGVIRYVDVGGRTKLALRDQISHYIPNPTFSKVAAPGSWGNTAANRGHGGVGGHTGVKPKVMPSLDAFFDPEPRLALMKDMGIDRTLLWPTLASVLEERLADDPDLAVVVIHALNQWMHEHWSFVYSDAIFSTPIISLAAGPDKALEELQYIHERGAKIFLIRVAPVPTWKGRKSFALAEFDPFWAEVERLDIVVGMHSGDSGLPALRQRVGGHPHRDAALQGDRLARRSRRWRRRRTSVHDAMASIIGHGLATRFPKLKFMPVEYWAEWIRPFVDRIRARTSGRRCSSTRTPSRCSSGTSTSTSSTSPTRRACSTWACPPTGSCSAPTSPTPRASPTRSPTARSSRASPGGPGADHGRHPGEGPQGRQVRNDIAHRAARARGYRTRAQNVR